MPFELGLFLGCRRFGPNNQSKKRTLVLDSDEYRYRAFISDIAGQDIRAHKGDPEQAIREVRNWLQATSHRNGLTGGGELIKLYRHFTRDLPGVCVSLSLEADKLTFHDLCVSIIDWLETNT